MKKGLEKSKNTMKIGLENEFLVKKCQKYTFS